MVPSWLPACQKDPPAGQVGERRLRGHHEVALGIADQGFDDALRLSCAEVNAAVRSEIRAVPADRLDAERELLGRLPSLRLEIGAKPISRKVGCISWRASR
jgi:hypothetical protein